MLLGLEGPEAYEDTLEISTLMTKIRYFFGGTSAAHTLAFLMQLNIIVTINWIGDTLEPLPLILPWHPLALVNYPLANPLERGRSPMSSFMAGNPALKDLYNDLKRRMDQSVADFQADLASTRTGRASVHMLDQVKVDYYGTPTPINQLAQLSAPEPQLIVISPWDPTILKGVEKAIQAADLGFNPLSDGKVIRVPVPAHDRGAPPRRLQAHQQGP